MIFGGASVKIDRTRVEALFRAESPIYGRETLGGENSRRRVLPMKLNVLSKGGMNVGVSRG
jgi:hypothetical protein